MFKFYGALLQPLIQASILGMHFNAQLTELVSDLLSYRTNDHELDLCLGMQNIIDDVSTKPGNVNYVNYRPISHPLIRPIGDVSALLDQVKSACLVDERPDIHDLNELCKNLAVGWIHRLRSRRIVAARLHDLVSVMEHVYISSSSVQVLAGRWRMALAQIADWSALDYDPDYDKDMDQLILAIEAIADPEVKTQE